MFFKRFFSIFLVLVLMASMFPAVYATEIDDTAASMPEVTEPFDATGPPVAEEDNQQSPQPEPDFSEPLENDEIGLNQALIDSGFTTDQIQKKTVSIEDPGDYGQ